MLNKKRVTRGMGWCGNQGCSSRPTPWKEWAASPRGKQSLFCSAEIDFLGKTLFEYTSATPRCICFPPRATSAQVHLVQVQVPLGYASVYLNLDSAYLRGVGGGHLVQLQLKYPSSKSKYTSATPRCTWTWTRGT